MLFSVMCVNLCLFQNQAEDLRLKGLDVNVDVILNGLIAVQGISL